jgi:hypothetical protein
MYHYNDTITVNEHGACIGIDSEGRRYVAGRSHGGIDYRQLDLRFLPYWLTAEKIEVIWDQEYMDDKYIVKPTQFYINLRQNHTPRFRRSCTASNIPHGSLLQSSNHYPKHSMVETVIGLGVRDPKILSTWSMKEVVNWRLNKLASLESLYGGVWRWGEMKDALEKFEFDM